MRPDVVLFGELLPAGVFERAANAAAQSDLCFVIGTSALVYPAMRLPEIALVAGAYTVEINPERTPFSDHCHAVLEGPAGEVLTAISGQLSALGSEVESTSHMLPRVELAGNSLPATSSVTF